MGLGKKTIDDENYAGKRVLVRCDFNVPMKDGVITNDNRINAALPTIKKLINDGAKVILCSHLGKPKNGPEAKFSLAPVAVRLSEKLGQPVTFADDDTVVGENAKAAVATMGNGDVVLLQNTRFRKEETKNEPAFSEELASLADAYVDDAFGSCHRAHCSTAGVTDYIKDTAVGYLMEKEIKYLGNAVNNPERPEDGTHTVTFSRELWMEQDDFMEDAPKKFFRMVPGKEVRLKNAYIVKCTGCKKAADGTIEEVYAEYDPNSRSGMEGANRKVKGTLHWLSVAHCLSCEVRLYDRLFSVENPAADERDFRELLNPQSLQILSNCYIEPFAVQNATGNRYLQFQRTGYFTQDKHSTPSHLIFNRTVGLKDSWSGQQRVAPNVG